MVKVVDDNVVVGHPTSPIIVLADGTGEIMTNSGAHK